jgi:hypothetical protein
VLVVPSSAGVSLFDHNGDEVALWTWTALIGCGSCTGEGASADGDGLLASFAYAPSGPPPGGPPGGGELDGGFLRIDAGGLDFALESGLSFPHDAVRDPHDSNVIVPEAFGDRVAWYPGDGSSSVAVHAYDVDATAPNGIDLIEDGGSTYLVMSNRGDGPGGGGGGGQVTLLDITDPTDPSVVWEFPEDGNLDTPHGPVLRWVDGVWWLLYAHSYGAPSTGGTIGLARTDDLRTLPTYLADLEVDGGLDFVRGVELTDDGVIIATDSGPEMSPGSEGRVLLGDLPDLEPTGASGAVDEDQVLVDWDTTVLVDGLSNPFEGWLWAPTFSY